MYAWILIKRIHRVTELLIDDEQGGFRSERGCIDQIFTLRQIDERAREKIKVYDRVNRKALWQVLRIYKG